MQENTHKYALIELKVVSIPNIDWSGSFHDCSSVLVDEALCGIFAFNMKLCAI